MLDRSMQALALAGGGLLILGGLALAVVEPVSAIFTFGFGAVIVVAVLLQRNRYRSLAAERTGQTPGPGGGEDGLLEPRFAPTPEVFVDPTSGRFMRVYLDPRSGERRYRAEG